jgi:hypothetical protein
LLYLPATSGASLDAYPCRGRIHSLSRKLGQFAPVTVQPGAIRAEAGVLRSRFWLLLRLSFGAHALYFVIVAIYAAAFLALVYSQPGAQITSMLTMAASFATAGIPFMIIGLVCARLCHVARRVRLVEIIPALGSDLWAFMRNPATMASGLPLIFALFPFMYVFAKIKSNIPMLVPFSWDAAFDDWDRIIHFGTRPWEWLQPVIGHWPVTFAINFNYNLWFVTMWFMWAYFAFARKPDELRTRFFLTFLLTWAIGGSLLAVVFSSAGPCYFTRLGLAPDPYAPLMAYLHAVNEIAPVWALNVQDMLWQGYVGEAAFKGISAMPSMHNATTLLFAIAAFRVNRTAGWILSVHATLIFLGSIHLGWHYAIDSYLAWALTILIWWLSAPIARWWHSQTQVRAYLSAIDGHRTSASL